MSRLGELVIDGVTYDLDDLTLNELEQIEDITGVPFSDVNYGSAKGLKAFSFVLMRRSNPHLTMQDAGEIKVAQFIEAEEDMPELPPDDRADQESQNQAELPRDDSGPQPSAESIPG